jgi:hypothetical protein
VQVAVAVGVDRLDVDDAPYRPGAVRSSVRAAGGPDARRLRRLRRLAFGTLGWRRRRLADLLTASGEQQENDGDQAARADQRRLTGAYRVLSAQYASRCRR